MMENNIKPSMVTTWVNLNSGLMYHVSMKDPSVLDHCFGKRVMVESLECGYLLIDGEYYEVVGTKDGLTQVRKLTELDNLREVMKMSCEEDDIDNPDTCPGFIWKSVQGKSDVVKEVRELIKDFCSDECCDDDCTLCQELREFYKEEEKDED